MEAGRKSIARGAIEGLVSLLLPRLDVRLATPQIPKGQERPTMTWEKPEFVEIKMDCEINSYQDDFQRDDFNGLET